MKSCSESSSSGCAGIPHALSSSVSTSFKAVLRPAAASSAIRLAIPVMTLSGFDCASSDSLLSSAA
ncbi:MAG TPA: hypothetical protein VHU23_02090 [Rhizomicrobium sp.]|nr:hypothetical protein [Rhizomicrobium sp.]